MDLDGMQMGSWTMDNEWTYGHLYIGVVFFCTLFCINSYLAMNLVVKK